MENLLVSGCLLGKNTKYNGKNNYIPLIEKIKERYNIIVICPEVMGGLSIPRDPSEISGNKVINNKMKDVTFEYISNLSTKKTKRSFTYEQRKILYNHAYLLCKWQLNSGPLL